jgi:hypothetical protein
MAISIIMEIKEATAVFQRIEFVHEKRDSHHGAHSLAIQERVVI